MFSISTMASSTRMPVDSVIARKLTRLSEKPKNSIAQKAGKIDKGSVIAVVLDGHGNELGRASTTASAVKPDFGHYDVTVSFSGSTSGTKGQIKVFGVSPKDGTTPTYYYFISVTFA